MKILVEGYTYSDCDLPKKLKERFFQNEKVAVVGYYNNVETDGSIIILPKVFVENQLLFGVFPYQDAIESDFIANLKNHSNSNIYLEFLHRFSLLLFLSIKTYQQRQPDNEIVEKSIISQVKNGKSESEITEIELIFALIDFYKQHRNLVLFTKAITHNQQFKKVNWQKTINKTLPILQQQTPIYHTVYRTQQTIDFEDELMTIYFSLIHYFNENYGFKLYIPKHQRIIRFDDKIKFSEQALRTLKRIRFKYFSDKLLRLYKLLKLYFEQIENAAVSDNKEEFLLVRNYELVFEDMIDKLLSDEKQEKELKKHADGKILDHIFEYSSLFQPDSIYYIGDSKFYKETTKYSKHTICKQHTYAKNVIQYNINLFNDNTLRQQLRYRDDLTEGYNITPNFFIQAYVELDKLLDFEHHFNSDKSKSVYINQHFENRLFDRDTLTIHHFKINFLFVLKSYITLNSKLLYQQKNSFKAFIKQDVKRYYNEHFDFYQIKPLISQEKFMERFFKKLIGKIYRNSGNELIFAWRKNMKIEVKRELIILLSQYAEIEDSKQI
ncbi:MAG: hypothetical protein AB8G11_06740 [Saprospiraceae bacterium]